MATSGQQLRRQLTEWVEALKDQRSASQKDRLSPEKFENLKKLCNDRPVTIRLAKILKNTADATQISKSFLLTVCKERLWHSTVSITPRSIRRRKILQVAKAARKLAGTIQWNTMSGVIPGDTDLLEFLTQHLYDSDLMPQEDNAGTYHYELDENGNPYSTTLSVLMKSFASALDCCAKEISRLPARTFTRLNTYTDSLAKLSREHLGRVDPVLIEKIVFAITGETFTPDAVSKRHRAKPTS